MQDLSHYYALVEEVITDIGVDPAVTRGAKAGTWTLVKGSAKVWVDVWYVEKQKAGYFQVMSPVMPLPSEEKLPALCRELLEINDQLFGVGFTIAKNYVWLKHIREVVGLDKSEVAAMMQRIGIYADQYDDHLIGKYASGSANPVEAAAPGAPSPPGKA
jgi:hypothetical protein